MSLASSAFVRSRAHAPHRLIASTLGFVLASTAAAESTPAETPDATPQATRLGAVKVEAATLSTSPKFTASLIDTPRSVDVIPSELIRDTGATTLVEALRTVPGITFGAGEGGNPNGDRPFIRGFDSQSSLFVDGMRSTGSQSREMFDVEQVEVTRGPSSAYTGRGAAGGSINLVSKAPRAHDFNAVTAGLGSDAYRRATLDVNRRVGDVAFRLNAMGHHNNVPGRNGPEQQRWGIAPSITFGVDTATSATLSWYHLDSDDVPDSGLPYNNPFAATSPNAALNGNGKPVNVPRDTFYGLLSRDFQKQKNDIGSVRLEHSFGNGWLLRNTTVDARSTNDYIWTQPDDSKGNFYLNGGVWRRTNTRASQTDSLTNQTDLTGDFNTGSVHHAIAAGAEIARETTTRDSYLVGALDPATGAAYPWEGGDPVTGACALGIGAASQWWCAPFLSPNPHDPWDLPVTRANNPTRIVTRTRSAWAFDTLTLSEHWLANLGVRRDYFNTHADSVGSSVANNAAFWNWQAGLVWKPIEEGSVYASWGTSATPPGVDAGDGADGISVANEDLKPERSRNLELGTKWGFADGALQLTGALFRTEMTNARVATGGRGSPQVNAGHQRVDGVEIGLSGKITETWSLYGGYTHLRSRILTPAPGEPTSQGNRFPNTPENSLSVWTSVQVTPRLTIGGGAFAMDKVYGNTANTKWVPGYTRLDAMAAFAVNRNLTLQLNLQNLTDKYYFDKAYASHYASVAPGRSAILSADVRF